MELAQPVDVDMKNKPLDQVLKVCFSNQPYTYEIVNKTIVLKLKETPVEAKKAPITEIVEVAKPVTGKVIFGR